MDVRAVDLAELKQAINDANDRPSGTHTIISLPAHFYLPEEEILPAINSKISIIGGVFHGVDGGPEQLFLVEPGAILDFNATRFVDFTLGFEIPGLFENHGELTFKSVRFTSITGEPMCLSRGPCFAINIPVVFNATSGNLIVDNSVFIDSGIKNLGQDNLVGGLIHNEGSAPLVDTQVYLPNSRSEAPLLNFGYMKLQNSSFVARTELGVPLLPLFKVSDEAESESVNSVFGGFAGGWCQKVKKGLEKWTM